MKIGILTFHWATNYGAILQAYALQTYLKGQGHDAEIINYRPARNIFLQRLTWIKNGEWGNFGKENKLETFRKKYLTVSKKKYSSNKDLQNMKDTYDLILCGSDQVWNFSFIQYAEANKRTYSYYLDFVGGQTKKAAYAASFGCNKIPFEYQQDICSQLNTFSHISVREKTAQGMVQELGLKAQVVVDPTLLLDVEKYKDFCTETEKKQGLFIYKLHNNQTLLTQTEKYLAGTMPFSYADKNTTLETWLQAIKAAALVLTNSFHGVVFSILFQTPFISVLVEGSDMNDRITTLLSSLGLQERIVTEYDEKSIERIRNMPIDWEDVARKLKVLRGESEDYLSSVINEK